MSIFIPNNKNDVMLDFKNYIDLNEVVSFSEYREFRSLLEEVDEDEGFGNLLRPVFIVLIDQHNGFSKFGHFSQDHIKTKGIKNRPEKSERYWHVALGIGPNLKHMYSFNNGHPEFGNNKKTGGLSFESIEGWKKAYPDGDIEVSCILLSKNNYSKLRDNLNYYIHNKEKTKYNLAGLLDFYTDNKKEDKVRLKIVCSQFVDAVLRQSGIKASSRSNNLTSPSDLRADSVTKPKQFKLYEGRLKDYDENAIKEVTKKVDEMSKKLSNEYFEKDDIKEDKD